MHVAITGSRGLLGSVLVPLLTGGGQRVTRIVRSRPTAPSRPADLPVLSWNPERGIDDPSQLVGVDAIVHLAGESIAAGRWTEARKAEIRRSRIEGTRRIAEALARVDEPPRVLVCASAVGYYGDRGNDLLDEQSAPGRGFLADLCRDWEAAAEPALRAGLRVVHLRLGTILSPSGGALAKLLPPFRLGAGGTVGSGEHYMSWIGIDDAAQIIVWTISEQSIAGPLNAVAPVPVTNAEFTHTLARVLGRPAVMRVPAFALRLALGELADEALLASQRAVPARLLAAGYSFRHPELEGALRHLLGRTLESR